MTIVLVNIRRASTKAVSTMQTEAVAVIHGSSEYELTNSGITAGGGARAGVTARVLGSIAQQCAVSRVSQSQPQSEYKPAQDAAGE